MAKLTVSMTEARQIIARVYNVDLVDIVVDTLSLNDLLIQTYHSHGKLEAIKEYRKRKVCTLLEAKNYVEQLIECIVK